MMNARMSFNGQALTAGQLHLIGEQNAERDARFNFTLRHNLNIGGGGFPKDITNNCDVKQTENGVKYSWTNNKRILLRNPVNFTDWISNLENFLSQAVKQGIAVPNGAHPSRSKPSSPVKPNGSPSSSRQATSPKSEDGSRTVVDLTGDDPSPVKKDENPVKTDDTLVKTDDTLVKTENIPVKTENIPVKTEIEDSVAISSPSTSSTLVVKAEESRLSAQQQALISSGSPSQSDSVVQPDQPKPPSKTTARKRTAPRKSSYAVPEKKKCVEGEGTAFDDVQITASSPGKSTTSKATARKRTAPRKMTDPQKKSPSRSPSPDVMITSAESAPKPAKEHPASLPPNPTSQPSASHTKALPPQPTLKVAHHSQGIVLNWTMSVPEQCEAIAAYQLFAYQEGSAPPTSSLWKKIGEPAALALPMACTLTQFQRGNKYHFAVRAMDKHKRFGPYSEPSSIHIPK